MKFQQQLPIQTQGYLVSSNTSAAPRKHFGSNKMASSTIFPSKNEISTVSFGKKTGGIKTEDQNDMKKSLVFKNQKVKPLESSLAPTSMYSSMMITSSSSNTNTGYTGSLFDQYLTKKPTFQPSFNDVSKPVTKQEENVDEIINRYKSVSCSSFTSPSENISFSKPTPTLTTPSSSSSYTKQNETITNPYTQLVSASNPKPSNNLKNSLIFDNFTVDDFKKRDNLYGCFDGYNKISQTKSYDTFYDKYGINPSSSYNDYGAGNKGSTGYGSGSEYGGSSYEKTSYDKPSYSYDKYEPSNYNYTSSNNYNYDYSSPINYSSSNYEIPSTAFTKKSYTDYNSPSYSIPTKPATNYSEMTNAERISSSKDFQCTLKESDFQIGKKLGKGQFGEVFLVKHKLTGFICALKIIPKTVIKEEKVEDQLVREIKIQSYLRNKNLVALYGFFSDYSNVYLLMQLCTDGHVFDILRKTRRIEEPKVREIVRDICMGLEYIHSERIIHRDIKPENVIIQNGVAKLCDFGWSVFRGQGLRNTFCGTPLYTSPQLIRGEQYDEKIDIWAIGILTYELLVGKIPFKIYSQDDLSRILQDKITFPEYVDLTYDAKDFILKLLDRSPGGTYLTIDNILGHPFLNVPKNYTAIEGAECI